MHNGPYALFFSFKLAQKETAIGYCNQKRATIIIKARKKGVFNQRFYRFNLIFKSFIQNKYDFNMCLD